MPSIRVNVRYASVAMTIRDQPEMTVSEVTRRVIIDQISGRWSGRLDETEFLQRLYDLESMPSTDGRFSSAVGDIYQHRINNPFDWPDDWVLTDRRFNILWGPDEEFLRFIAETVHPAVRQAEESEELIRGFNEELAKDGWVLVETRQLSGRPVYGAQRLEGRAVIFEEPTGWPKVDRQIQRAREMLNLAKDEEQFQAVGLLCREIIISVAQATYDAAKYPPTDEVEPSDTDAARMIAAIVAVELAGGANEQARAHAKAALKLANATQHGRTSDYRQAALALEAASAVVNIVAVLMGRRDRHG